MKNKLLLSTVLAAGVFFTTHLGSTVANSVEPKPDNTSVESVSYTHLRAHRDRG